VNWGGGTRLQIRPEKTWYTSAKGLVLLPPAVRLFALVALGKQVGRDRPVTGQSLLENNGNKEGKQGGERDRRRNEGRRKRGRVDEAGVVRRVGRPGE